VHDHWSNFKRESPASCCWPGADGNGTPAAAIFDYADFETRHGLTYALTTRGSPGPVNCAGFGVSYVEAGKAAGQLYRICILLFAGDSRRPERRAAVAA